MVEDNDISNEQLEALIEEVREMALRARDKALSESLLAVVPYLERGEMDGVSFQHLENQLPKIAIEKAKERMLRDLQIRIAKRMMGDDSCSSPQV